MSAAGPYVDTSALAKWYLPEPGAEQFAAFIAGHTIAVISRLAVVELHSILNRRRHAGEIKHNHVARVVAVFERQIAEGLIEVYPLDDRHAVEAAGIMQRIPDQPLRTLDALHLAIALDIEASHLVTADRVLAASAKALGLKAVLVGV